MDVTPGRSLAALSRPPRATASARSWVFPADPTDRPSFPRSRPGSLRPSTAARPNHRHQSRTQSAQSVSASSSRLVSEQLKETRHSQTSASIDLSPVAPGNLGQTQSQNSLRNADDDGVDEIVAQITSGVTVSLPSVDDFIETSTRRRNKAFEETLARRMAQEDAKHNATRSKEASVNAISATKEKFRLPQLRENTAPSSTFKAVSAGIAFHQS